MSNIDDLGHTSILTMDDAEALNTIMAIRLSRRIKKTSPRKPSKSTQKRNQKEPDVTPEQAARLLALLTGQ